MRKPGRGQILENRLVGPREVLGGGDRRVPAKGRGRTAPCRGRSGASWIWATPLTPARARGSSVRATPSLRPPRILKTSLFLQKGGPRKEPSQRTATALFYLIPCGDFQLSPREFYLSLIIHRAFPSQHQHELFLFMLVRWMGFVTRLDVGYRHQGPPRAIGLGVPVIGVKSPPVELQAGHIFAAHEAHGQRIAFFCKHHPGHKYNDQLRGQSTLSPFAHALS